MTYRARVESPARLHFGFVWPVKGFGRRFGGVGAAVDHPGFVVEGAPSTDVDVEVSVEDDGGYHRSRVEGFAHRAVDLLDVDGVSLDVERVVPAHVGLGSGTQTALAVAEAVALAHGVELEPTDAAEHLGRGRRSGVGVAAYRDGGFVVDGGLPVEEGGGDASEGDGGKPEIQGHGVPDPLVQVDLPDCWRFVVVQGEERGNHGDEEDRLMQRLSSVEVDESYGSRALDAVYRQMVPGAVEGDIEEFGLGLGTLGELNGDVYFEAGVQSERYVRTGVVESLVEMDEVYAAGQSSWGPSVYGLATEDVADDVAGCFTDVEVLAPESEGAVSKVQPL